MTGRRRGLCRAAGLLLHSTALKAAGGDRTAYLNHADRLGRPALGLTLADVLESAERVGDGQLPIAVLLTDLEAFAEQYLDLTRSRGVIADRAHPVSSDP